MWRAEEGEDAEQQRGHEQEGEVERRVVLAVQRVGVRDVLGEADGGVRVALRAGGRRCCPCERRESGLEAGRMSWCAVAVVAGGHVGGDVRACPSAIALP